MLQTTLLVSAVLHLLLPSRTQAIEMVAVVASAGSSADEEAVDGRPAKYSLYRTEWTEQPLDHFTFTTNSTFRQRYLVNDTFWKKGSGGGPIFFYAGNEGDIESFAQNTGFMWDTAAEFGAMLIFAEHRYYGKSVPAAAAGNGYLTSEQALADYALLLVRLKKELLPAAAAWSRYSPVIAFGGSYGGMLAAWLRIKYPHLVAGAIASSAPVVVDGVPCNTFDYLTTANFFRAGGQMCVNMINRSWTAIDNISGSPDGVEWLEKRLNPCRNSTSRDLGQDLKNYLDLIWGMAAMLNYPYPTSFLVPLPANPVMEICKRMTSSALQTSDSDRELIDKVIAGASVYFNHTGTVKCLEMGYPSQLGNIWDYQACSEIIFPSCSDSNDMFEPIAWDPKAFSKTCQKNWNVTPMFGMMEMMYGGANLKAASNIVFSNGLLDPWAGFGIPSDINDSVLAIWIPDGAHHLDLRGTNKKDPISVIKARKIERAQMKKWIIAFHNASPKPSP